MRRCLKNSLGLLLAILSMGNCVGIALAAPTDSGSITLTGTVQPRPTSFFTELQLHAETTPLQQDQQLRVEVVFRSDNAVTLPMTLQAEWQQGTIDGASEATVQQFEYVVGSASKAFGTVEPYVDVQAKTITWVLPVVPGGSVTHSVNFLLKTTSTYTGSKIVRAPIRLKVLSPIGVPDREVIKDYHYLPPPPGPTTIPTLTASPSAGVTPKPRPQATFTSITLPSIGAISAKIMAETTQPVGLQLRYGLSPSALTQTQVIPAASYGQPFIVMGLKPETRYYYRVDSLTSPSVQSDIFVFTTASMQADASLVKPSNLTVTQQRTVIYAGEVIDPSEVAGGESVPAMVVSNNAVVDVSLNLPQSETINSVEIVIRSIGVLGWSSEPEVDELQSTTTKLVRTTGNTYVGKLRTPAKPGIYELVSRIEDIYGNLTESELGRMVVMSPFTVVDGETKKPLEHARVMLYVYNNKTQLYEKVSNVTTAVQNPVYADARGVVELNVFPGKFRADIDLPGYVSQQLFFEVGTQTLSYLPQVSLVAKQSVLGGRQEYVLAMLWHIGEVQLELFKSLAKSERMFSFMLSSNVLLLFLTVVMAVLLHRFPHLEPELWLQQQNLSSWRKIVAGVSLVLYRIGQFCAEFFIILSVIFGVLFYALLGPQKGILSLALTSASLVLWSVSTFLLHHRHEERTQQLKSSTRN